VSPLLYTDRRQSDRFLLRSRPLRVLIFNCTSGRSGTSFLAAIFERLALQLRLHKRDEQPHQFFDRVIFCSNVTYASGNFKGGQDSAIVSSKRQPTHVHFTPDLATKSLSDTELTQLKTQNELANAWRSILPNFPDDHIHVLPSIEHAINIVRDQVAPTDVLVAGSLHLVGGVIEVAGLTDVAL
jgi:folylpolyglutamate synthase